MSTRVYPLRTYLSSLDMAYQTVITFINFAALLVRFYTHFHKTLKYFSIFFTLGAQYIQRFYFHNHIQHILVSLFNVTESLYYKIYLLNTFSHNYSTRLGNLFIFSHFGYMESTNIILSWLHKKNYLLGEAATNYY